MSTYLLRNVSKVQPQPKPATTAILPGGPALFIGLTSTSLLTGNPPSQLPKEIKSEFPL